MAQILLHGTLHATIFEAESLSNPHRATGGAPKFIRKVRTVSPSLLSSVVSPLLIASSLTTSRTTVLACSRERSCTALVPFMITLP
jgi:hypothetical protein